jgi:amino acid adenylation domain-containing protein
MLTDNFPFKAYSTKSEDTFINEVVCLPEPSLVALSRLSTSNETSREAIICALLSIYLYKYMEDSTVSTICLTQDKTALLQLPIDRHQNVAQVARDCDTLINNAENYFIDEGYVIIRVNSDPTQTPQEISGQYQFLFDVSLSLDGISIALSYRQNTLLNDADKLIVHQLSHLIGDVEKIWKKDIASLSLMSDSIRDNILNNFRIHHQTFDYHYGIYQRFSDQVQANPNNIAIVFSSKEMTFNKLDRAVDELAATLYHKGAKGGDRVGVFLHRSEYSVVSILAILKLGCSYIPLDCTYPSQYIDNIQQETDFKFALSETSLIEHLAPIHCQIINVMEVDEKYSQYIAKIPSVYPKPHDEFAILYTSGTTGKPKGAIYNHASPLNKFSWMWDFFKFDQTDVFLQRTSVNFSPSLWELFGALLIGLKTVIVPDSVVKDPARLVETIGREKVTFMGVVPALLRMLFEDDKQAFTQFDRLRYISCSGEPMQIDLYQKIKNIVPNVRIFNDYGSTEMNAVGYSEITDDSTLSKNFPIGKPISNVHYYILDDNLQLVPPFMAGNLYVGGVSLLNGYVGDVQSPFINDPILNSGIQFFKSGDKARFLADGKIELVGRDDFIVKVRGMRVSLYQVETVIKSHTGVADACVVSRKKSNGENEIVAYLSSDEAVLTIRNYCMSVLPEYMVPSKLVNHGVLPKKTNGKLDRKYLADLAAHDEYEKPVEITNSDDVSLTLFELTRAALQDQTLTPTAPSRYSV